MLYRCFNAVGELVCEAELTDEDFQNVIVMVEGVAYRPVNYIYNLGCVACKPVKIINIAANGQSHGIQNFG